MDKTSDLEYHIGYWLRFVSNHVSFSFRDRIAPLGVTVAEWVALRSLHNRAPCTLGDLAQQMGTDPAASSRLVEKLLKKKLVSRVPSAADRRSVTVALTDDGRKLVAKIAQQADDNDAAFFDQLPDADKAHLLRIMQKLVAVHALKEKPTE
jgi:DNA-binding MarR family transcriptional regulator